MLWYSDRFLASSWNSTNNKSSNLNEHPILLQLFDNVCANEGMGFLKAQPYWVRDTHIESVGGEHEITIVARPIPSVRNLLIWRFKSTKNWEMNFDLAVDPFNGSWKEPYVSKEIFQGMYHQQHTGFSKKFDKLRSHHMDTHCSGYFKESGVRDSHASTDRYEPS